MVFGRYNDQVDIPPMFAISRSLGFRGRCIRARWKIPKGEVKRLTDE
jgi:hypothetical protein